MTRTLRRLALLTLLVAFAATATGCHREHCRDNDRRYLDKSCPN